MKPYRVTMKVKAGIGPTQFFDTEDEARQYVNDCKNDKLVLALAIERNEPKWVRISTTRYFRREAQ